MIRRCLFQSFRLFCFLVFSSFIVFGYLVSLVFAQDAIQCTPGDVNLNRNLKFPANNNIYLGTGKLNFSGTDTGLYAANDSGNLLLKSPADILFQSNSNFLFKNSDGTQTLAGIYSSGAPAAVDNSKFLIVNGKIEGHEVNGLNRLCVQGNCITSWPAASCEPNQKLTKSDTAFACADDTDTDTRCDTSGTCNQLCIGSSCYNSWATAISSNGGSGVSSINPGAGISVSSTTGNVTLSNTGITSLIAGSGITLSGSIGDVTISAASGGGGGGGGKQMFTSSGTFTVPAGVTSIWITMSGGGGGGGGDGEGGIGGIGGGAHAVIAQKITVISGGNIPVTVGAGGNAGTTDNGCGGAGGSGTAGGTSSFGSYISTPGGEGGGGGSQTGCGSYDGSNGSNGIAGGSGGADNGNSIFGNGGAYSKNGSGFGGGGGGRANGAPGFVLVEYGSGGSDWTLSGSDLYTNDVSWNVGIGNTNPGYKLDVTGQINATSALCLNGICFNNVQYSNDGEDTYGVWNCESSSFRSIWDTCPGADDGQTYSCAPTYNSTCVDTRFDGVNVWGCNTDEYVWRNINCVAHGTPSTN